MGSQRASLRPTHFQPGDLVICRSKAPLVKAAYYLLKNHIPARILGKDIGRGLVAFVDAMKSSGIVDLLKRVEEWTSKAIARACELDDEAAMEEAADKRDVLVAVADGVWAQDNDCDSVDVFKTRLESLFGEGEDKDKVVTLSTCHRAKGAEADRVWWLDYHKPDLGANFKHEWQRKESRNIRFVSLTRARKELRLIRSESLR
jgi:superfamily I DNA/RNA helicase